MSDDDLTGAGRAGLGAACVVCCVAPMLVLAGVVSLAALLAGGVALGSVALVGSAVWVLHRQRIPKLGRAARAAVGAVGVLLALVGLATIDGSSTSLGRSLVSSGVALLACAAVLSLAAARTTDGDTCSAPGTG
jgi:hypothetical protein